VKRTVIFYGLLGGALIEALKLVEYRFLVLEHSLEIYGGIIALLFSLLGIWLGLKLTRTRETVVVREVPVRVEVEVRVPVAGPFVRNEARLGQLGITPRELEILETLAAGAQHSGDRRTVVREREHRQDAYRPAVRQAVGEAADPGGTARKRGGAHPLKGWFPGFPRENHPFGRRGDGGGAARLPPFTRSLHLPRTRTMKKIVLTFGLISGAILSVMMLITLPFHDALGFDRSLILGYTSMVLAFLLVFFGVRSYRDNIAGGSVSFGRALAVGA
jgi:hypothetical protein